MLNGDNKDNQCIFEKWFENHGRRDIVNAGTAAQRKRAIAMLSETDSILFKEY